MFPPVPPGFTICLWSKQGSEDSTDHEESKIFHTDLVPQWPNYGLRNEHRSFPQWPRLRHDQSEIMERAQPSTGKRSEFCFRQMLLALIHPAQNRSFSEMILKRCQQFPGHLCQHNLMETVETCPTLLQHQSYSRSCWRENHVGFVLQHKRSLYRNDRGVRHDMLWTLPLIPWLGPLCTSLSGCLFLGQRVVTAGWRQAY